MKLSERIEVIRRGRAEVVAERHSRAQGDAAQQRSLSALLGGAHASSPFHRERLSGHLGLRVDELDALPVMDKDDLVDSFAAIVSDPRLTREAVAEHVATIDGGDPLLFGEYRVLSTGGTSGITTYVPVDRRSWSSVLAPYFGLAFAYGFTPRLFPRRRIASVTATGPLHMSNRMAATNRSPAYPALQLDVTAPLDQLSAALERFRPDILVGYPSVLGALAERQRVGDLTISPRWIIGTSEQMTPGARTAMREAWTEPFDVYSTTETGGVLAYECPAHAGLHLRETMNLVEAVDQDDRLVPDGERGSALLVTSWLNRTLPLIRYRIEDSVVLSAEPCPCGRASRRIVGLAGRREAGLELAGVNGTTVTVHPNLFEETIEERPEVARYQVVQRAEAITVSVVARDGGPTQWSEQLAEELARRLRTLGAAPPPIRVELVNELARSDSVGAKLKLVRSEL
jgi:phenylacetate-CoA ligase